MNNKHFIVAGKFDLKNTVINIVAGLGLLSFITMFCDFVLLNYVKERKIVSTDKGLDINSVQNQKDRECTSVFYILLQQIL